MSERPKPSIKILHIPFSYLFRLIGSLKKKEGRSLEQQGVTKIVNVEKFFTQAYNNGVTNQPYLPNSAEVIGDLSFNFHVVPAANHTYDLRVEIKRNRKSPPKHLKITFFPDSDFTGIANFESNILYLDANESILRLNIPGGLIATHKGILPIKIENAAKSHTP